MWYGIVAIVYILVGMALWKDLSSSSHYNSLARNSMKCFSYFLIVFGWIFVLIVGLILYACGVDIRGKE